MIGIPQLNPIGPGQLSVPSSYPSQLPLSRYFDMGSSQYGVSSGIASGLGGLANAMPIIGPILGAGLNLYAQQQQNNQQAAFFEQYMSPSARMAQMRAAGINPNAAAQGISGSAAPQMNAAAPTNAFSSLAEALGNSVNTALSAQNIVAQTKNLEVQTEGQDLQNKVAEVELGMKPDMLSAELDDLKESANEKRQTVINLKKEIERYNQEIKTLKSEENYNVAKTGQVEFDNRLKTAITERERAEAALARANKELVEVNKQIQEKERDNYLTPEERIKMPIETEYTVDPVHAEFRDTHEAIKSLDDAISQCQKNELALWDAFQNHEISGEEYNNAILENDQLRKELRWSKKDAERAFDKQSYKNGYHTWWQDNATSLINSVINLTGTLGSAAIHAQGMKAVGSKTPEFRRKVFDSNTKGNTNTKK